MKYEHICDWKRRILMEKFNENVILIKKRGNEECIEKSLSMILKWF
ncbi:hypothetical protein bwei_2873 [Bacillus mycoides]|nr:hypothetical protein bwei_2873 [Bacillus mycoides]EEL02916.1 hypothetical protein bcere0014_55240 [Bacillus cereus BDRD-ST196]